ncbi:DinB family protein [Hymenobacter lutimineralis]|uniref:DinB family protein n=1 Tax=Hymenobacter lutimineralis TaxID=2606448 RepID=A0A5D6V4F6_9BACT|nr:DinB family protein [Hymenobacter lutimineralis]TYZ10015.1 DinB family protein [Hymenobacter lutimineralis]
MSALPEVWLRGPLPDVPALLQPIAHALLQAQEELDAALAAFPDHLLAVQPAGVASVGFHLRHLAGVLDRLATYARRETLTPDQLAYLAAENDVPTTPGSTAALLQHFHHQVAAFLEQLRSTPEQSLTDYRPVGRAQLPSTVVGLLTHAAEHTTRHVGQLLVTARIVQG